MCYGATYAAKAIYAVKVITEWVEIGIDCYIPYRKLQLNLTPHHGFTPSCAGAFAHRIISISTIGMQLLKIRNCFVILVITVRESSKRRGPIMLKQLVALLHLSLLDLVTSGVFAAAFLTGRILLPPLFNGTEIMRTSTDKANLFAGNFSCNPTLDDGSQQIFHLILNRDLALRISPPKWFLVQSMILMHPKPLAPT